jgi:hypothetical protein
MQNAQTLERVTPKKKEEPRVQTVQAVQVVPAADGDRLGMIRAAIVPFAPEILQIKKALGVLVEYFFFDLLG